MTISAAFPDPDTVQRAHKDVATYALTRATAGGITAAVSTSRPSWFPFCPKRRRQSTQRETEGAKLEMDEGGMEGGRYGMESDVGIGHNAATFHYLLTPNLPAKTTKVQYGLLNMSSESL